MKTKNLIFVAITFVFSLHGFSQEISENKLNNNQLTSIDYEIVKTGNAQIKYRRAAFIPSPEYISLQEFINAHIRFPDDAVTIGATGSVHARIEILENGSPGKIYFIQSPDPLFTKEVERVLRMSPPFTPAIKDGRIVRSFEQVKINFTLR